ISHLLFQIILLYGLGFYNRTAFYSLIPNFFLARFIFKIVVAILSFNSATLSSERLPSFSFLLYLDKFDFELLRSLVRSPALKASISSWIAYSLSVLCFPRSFLCSP